MQISAHLDPSGVLKLLDPKRQLQLMLRLTNSVGAKAVTQIKRTITSGYWIKSAAVRIRRIKATQARLTNQFIGSSRPIRLTRYKYKPVGRGIDVQIERVGSPRYIEGGFIAQPKGRRYSGQGAQVTSKVPLLFQRKGLKAYGLMRPESYSPDDYPSIGKLVVSREAQDAINRMIQQDGPKMFQSEWNRIAIGRRVL